MKFYKKSMAKLAAITMMASLVVPMTAVQASTSNSGSSTSYVTQAATRLSAADARAMVIAKFGSPSIIEKIEYTYDERNPMYKGEATKDGWRVSFEINARTRAVVKWDVGNDNGWDDYAHALPNMITMNRAANLVIARSGKTNTFVQKIDFKYDGRKTIYQGEAFNRGQKFVFEINAYSGQFKKWTVDNGDETWIKQYFNVR